MVDENRKCSHKYSETVAEKIAVANKLLDNILSNVGEVLQPERYIKYLDLIERFHWYSYVNNLLILSQFPQAQYLAGYETWKRTALSEYNDPSRRILNPTETGKGIKLIAPFTVVTDETRSLINFVVPVYDVNQVNEIPVPENDFIDLNKCSYVDIINAINFVAPYRTVFASNEDKNLSSNVKGYCNHSLQQFVVDSRLQVRALLSLLLHEFIEAELYLFNYKNEVLHGLVVESVFYILIKHFKLNTDNITFSYISRFKDAEKEAVAESFLLIQSIAHLIIDKIEEHLEFIIELTPAEEETSYQLALFDELENV